MRDVSEVIRLAIKRRARVRILERKRQKQLLSWMVEWVVLPKIAVEVRTLVRKVFGV